MPPCRALLVLVFVCLSSVVARAQQPAADAARGSESARDALTRSQSSGDPADGAALLTRLVETGQYEQVLGPGGELLNQPDVAAVRQAEIITAMAKASAASKTFTQAAHLRAAAETIAPQVTDAHALHRLWTALAAMQHAQADFAGAEQLHDRGARAAASGTMLRERWKSIQDRSVMQAQQGKYPAAAEGLLQALALSEKTGNPQDIADTSKSLGALHFYLKDWTRAIEFTRSAVELDTRGPAAKSSLNSNLGAMYLSAGDEKGAYAAFERALQIGRENGLDAANPALNLGFLLHTWGRYAEAIEHYRMAEQVYEKKKAHEYLGVVRKNIGETLAAMGRREEAAKALQQSYDLYKQHEIRAKRLELYPVMIDNLAALGRHAEALTLMREYKELSDQTVTVESNERIGKLQSAYDLATKERALAASERDRAVQQAAINELESEQQAQRTVATALAAGLMMSSILAVVLIRAIRFRGRANRALAEKNREVSELNQRLDALSKEDALTGLHNRHFLESFLTEMHALRHDSPDEQRMLVLVVDLDRFKEINDRWGHQTGDEVLQEVAEALRRCAAPDDVLVRWGGDEFLWLRPGASIAEGETSAARLHRAMATARVIAGGKPVAIGCSIGVAELPLGEDPKSDLEDAIQRADAAMYQAKARGRGAA